VLRVSQCIGAAAVVCLLVVSCAFFAAPRACEGGFETYLKCGVLALIVLAALPFVLRSGNSAAARVGLGFGCVSLGVVAWVVGLFVANVNFLCRVF
jgi:hypothetical protein